MRTPKELTRHFVGAVVASALLFWCYLWVAPYAHVFSINLALSRTVYLGEFQSVLGEVFSGVALGVLAALTCFFFRIRTGVAYIAIGITVVVVAGFIMLPVWPSHNLVRVAGGFALVITTVLCCWLGLLGLTTHSRPTSSAPVEVKR